MRDWIAKVLEATSGTEHFEQQEPSQLKENLFQKHAIAFFFAAVIVEILVLVFGKFLWNHVLTRLVTIAKPAESIWQILGVSILLKLLYN